MTTCASLLKEVITHVVEHLIYSIENLHNPFVQVIQLLFACSLVGKRRKNTSFKDEI